jgi:hypothetical protein
MVSSRTDGMRSLARCYDHALEALAHDDLERVTHLVDTADTLLAELALELRAGDDDQHSAQESLGRLLAAMRAEQQQTGLELQKVRQGRSVLRRYGNRLDSTGSQHLSDA